MARRTNVKRPLGLWPQPYEVDSAINKRAQAMARMKKSFSRSDSDKAAGSLINALYGRNAVLEGGERQRIKDVLWEDYQSYPSGYKGFHRTAVARKGRRKLAKLGFTNPAGTFEARAKRAIKKGEKFLVSLPARLRGKRRKR